MEDDPDQKPNLLEQYAKFLEVFGEEEFKALPPHRPYSIGIDLTKGAKLPTGPVYSMMPSESKSLKKHLNEELRNGKIRPTKAPGGTPVRSINSKAQKSSPN